MAGATDKGTEGTQAKVLKRADVIACAKGADLARLISKDGRSVRNRIRKGFGDKLPSVYVSKGGILTDAHKVACVESFGYTVK